MGNKVATFSDQQLECYQDCTYFTRKEILMVFRRFRDLDPNRVPKVMSDEDCTNIRVAQEKLERMPDLKENPLKERICKVFSSDSSGNMTFDDFLNMCSLFNEQCPRNTKIHYAFQIYDYDSDGFVGMDDLKKTLIALTKNRLTPEEVDIVCSKVLDEADHDNDGQISFLEFKHVVSRSPDFMRQSQSIHKALNPRFNKEFFKRIAANVENLEISVQRRSSQSDICSTADLGSFGEDSKTYVKLKDKLDKLEKRNNEAHKDEIDKLKEQLENLEDRLLPIAITLPNRWSKKVPPEDVIIDQVTSNRLANANLTKVLSHIKLSFINNCYTKSVVGPNSHYYYGIGAKLQYGISDFFTNQLERNDFLLFSGLCLAKSAVIEASNSRTSKNYLTDPCQILSDEPKQTTTHLVETSRESMLAFLTTLGHRATNEPLRLVTSGAGYRAGNEWFDSDERKVTQFQTVHALTLTPSIEQYSIKEYISQRDLIWETYKKLELPSRLVQCSLDSMYSNEYDAHRIDIWLPSRQEWLEVGRISHYLDYITIRAGLKRGHIIDSMVYDGQVLMAAIIENNQIANGKFIIPTIIGEHMNGLTGDERSNYLDRLATSSVLNNYQQKRYFKTPSQKSSVFSHSKKADRENKHTARQSLWSLLGVLYFLATLIYYGKDEFKTSISSFESLLDAPNQSSVESEVETNESKKETQYKLEQ